MKILNFKDFTAECNLKKATMNESDLQRVILYIQDIRNCFQIKDP